MVLHFAEEGLADLGATCTALMPNVILQSTFDSSSRIIIRVIGVAWKAPSSSALLRVKGRKVFQILIDLDQALDSFFHHQARKLLNLTLQEAFSQVSAATDAFEGLSRL